MNPKEVLQTTGSELDRLREQIISCDPAAPQPLAKVESLTGRLLALHQELSSLNAAELPEILQSILTKAKRVQTLLDAGAAFHCHSIFGRAEASGTYTCDGNLSASHNSRMIFQG